MLIERYGEEASVDCSKTLPNSISQGITIELRWNFIEMRERRNLLRTVVDSVSRLFRRDIDLDLGVFYELNDGTRGLIDPVQFNSRGGTQDQQTSQGSFKYSPYIWHMGDDLGHRDLLRFCERIVINPIGLHFIKRMQVYAFIWKGVPSWLTTEAKVEIKVGDTPVCLMKLDNKECSGRFCVISEMTVQPGNVLRIKKLSTFHRNHSACDEIYGWGFHWTSGIKR